MSRQSLAAVLVVSWFAAGLAGAQPSGPVIRSATLMPATGVLTIAGEHLGPEVQVIVDGQPVTTLPGATDAHIEVQAPVTVLTMPGTYRLVVVDPVRQAWDGFVVVNAPAVAPAGVALAGTPAAAAIRSDGDIAAPLPAAPTPATRAPAAPQPLAVIEDANAPFRTALGFQALGANTSGAGNTGVGYQALAANTLGPGNAGFGYQALNANTVGSRNTAVGYQALRSATTSVDNTAVGYRALDASTGTNGSNTAMGSFTLTSNTTGLYNVAVGVRALVDNVDGSFNTAVGTSSASNLVAGSHNTAIGHGALLSDLSGGTNVAIGDAALALTTDHRNTGVGYWAGHDATTGTYNIYLGADVVGTAADSNTMRLGLPFTGTAGQNRTFIAGIRGTTVTGGEGVYVDASGQLGSGPVVPAANTVGAAQVIADSLTAANLAPNSVGTSELVDGAVTAAKVAFTFADLGANTFVGNQTISSGNLLLPVSTGTSGNLLKGGLTFLHDSGVRSAFVGARAGNLTSSGADNAGFGQSALSNLTTGALNTGTGSFALSKLNTGAGNSAHGYQALSLTTSGGMNTAVGHAAGQANTTGSYNIFLGADVVGTASDANTMRLGLPYDVATGAGQSKTFIAGVYPTILNGPARPVFVDANGQIGTMGPPAVVAGPGVPAPAPQPSSPELEAQRQLIAAQAAVIADLQARVAALEAAGRRRR